MKKILLFIGLALFLFSCKKDKLIESSPCFHSYYEHSVPFDMEQLDAVVAIDTMTLCSGPQFIYEDTNYRVYDINPNNPNQIVYYEFSNTMNWNLYVYNFCTNQRKLLLTSSLVQDVSWGSNGSILISVGTIIAKVNLNIDSMTTVVDGSDAVNVYSIEYNPNAKLFEVSYINNHIAIFKNDGSQIEQLSNQYHFLGWYDNQNLLVEDSVMVKKVNVNTGIITNYITGNFFSYDTRTNLFTKKIVTGGKFYGETTWKIYDSIGNLNYILPSHLNLGSQIGFMEMGNENKLIVGMVTCEFENGIPSCALNVQHKVMIMNMDGTDVREVKFPD